ncbi:hypothetical protein GCM10023310_69950 [Paenibacillus vulneris]
MLKDLQTVPEIDQFFEELETKANWKMQRAQIYGLAHDYQQQLEKEKEIEKQVESKYRKIIKTTIISEDMAIVEAESKLGEIETNYYPVVFGKFHSESCMTFDEALVLALSRKYGQDRFAPAMIYNMLRMDLGARED